MKRDAKYWAERFKLIEQAEHNQGAAAAVEIEKQYREAQRQIEAKLDAWYRRFAQNNQVSMTEARKMLTGRDLKEFKWDVHEYIRYGEENAINGQWVKELENASARVHISRLEAMKIQMQQQVEVLFGGQLDTIDAAMRGIYLDGYYRTAYEVHKGVGFGWDFGTLDQRRIDKVINKPWAQDGRNFSDRVWSNKQKLVNELNTTLTQNIVLGQDPQKAIDVMAKRLNVSKNTAGRLVMTEQAAFCSAAQHDCFKDLDVEEFEIVATLDSHTSEICQEMDGKHFKMSEWETGITAPPFHVWCRSTTVPYFPDDFGEPGERAARDEDGKTYMVPADMTYKEWSKAFVQGNKSGVQPTTVQTSGNNPVPTAVGQSFDGYDQTQQADLEQLYNNAPQEIKDLYAKYGNQLKPVDENVDPTIGEAYFSHSDQRVHMHKVDAAAGNEYEEPFQVHFHEYAHNIDYLAGGGQSFSRTYKNAAQKTLEDVIMDDCEESMKQYFKDTAAKAAGVYQKAFDTQLKTGGMGAEAYVRSLLYNYRSVNGMSRSDPLYQLLKNELDAAKTEKAIRDYYTKYFDKFGEFVYDKSKVLDSFSDYIKMNHSKKEYSNLSDLFGRYSVQCGKSSFTFGFGHKPSYITGTGNLSAEAFAEMTDATIASPGALDLIKKYLPNAYSMYLEMLKRM